MNVEWVIGNMGDFLFPTSTYRMFFNFRKGGSIDPLVLIMEGS
jgi:hypothetical protein